MKLQILGDEGLNGRIVASLRQASFQVDWILEAAPGISDEEVIALAKEKSRS